MNQTRVVKINQFIFEHLTHRLTKSGPMSGVIALGPGRKWSLDLAYFNFKSE